MAAKKITLRPSVKPVLRDMVAQEIHIPLIVTGGIALKEFPACTLKVKYEDALSMVNRMLELVPVSWFEHYLPEQRLPELEKLDKLREEIRRARMRQD